MQSEAFRFSAFPGLPLKLKDDVCGKGDDGSKSLAPQKGTEGRPLPGTRAARFIYYFVGQNKGSAQSLEPSYPPRWGWWEQAGPVRRAICALGIRES